MLRHATALASSASSQNDSAQGQVAYTVLWCYQCSCACVCQRHTLRREDGVIVIANAVRVTKRVRINNALSLMEG